MKITSTMFHTKCKTEMSVI